MPEYPIASAAQDEDVRFACGVLEQRFAMQVRTHNLRAFLALAHTICKPDWSVVAVPDTMDIGTYRCLECGHIFPLSVDDVYSRGGIPGDDEYDPDDDGLCITCPRCKQFEEADKHGELVTFMHLADSQVSLKQTF